jgi:hypothetical protein
MYRNLSVRNRMLSEWINRVMVLRYAEGKDF